MEEILKTVLSLPKNTNWWISGAIFIIFSLFKGYKKLFTWQSLTDTELKLLPLSERANINQTNAMYIGFFLLFAGFSMSISSMENPFSQKHLPTLLLGTIIFAFVIAVLLFILKIFAWLFFKIQRSITNKKIPSYDLRTVVFDKYGNILGEVLNNVDDTFISIATSSNWNKIIFIKKEDITNYSFEIIPKKEIKYPELSCEEIQNKKHSKNIKKENN